MAYAENQITLEVVEDGNEVYVTEPTTPYATGDLYVDKDETSVNMVTDDDDPLVDSAGDLLEAVEVGESDIYVCTNPRGSGSFNNDDWKLAASTQDKKLREHFWHDANGAHVLGDETGFRNDITSTGMKIVDTSSETSVAEFGSNGARIGQSGDTHLEMDYHSLKLVDKEASTYLYISDLRDTNGNITITKEGDGTTTAYSARFPVSGVSKITIDGVETTAYTYSDGVVTFNTAPSDGSIIAFTYIPDSQYKDGYKAFTLGLRKYNNATPFTYALGYKVDPSNPYAYAEGYMTEAGYMAHAEGSATVAGYGSHSEGAYTEANGNYSHAEGAYSKAQGDGSHAGNYYTIAQGAMQTAIGRFNVAQGDPNIAHNSDYAFIIGNGTADSSRSTAFAVDWTGNIYPQNTKMTDFVTSYGTSGDWRYRRWKSGKIEAWYEGDVSLSATTAIGNVYHRSWSLNIPSAIGFDYPPHTICSYDTDSTVVIGVNGEADSATHCKGHVFRAQAQSTTGTGAVKIYAWSF